MLEARSADEALDFLNEHSSLKLDFTDIQMPGDLNGLELAHRIAEECPNICIIIASGAVSPPKEQLPTSARFIPKQIGARLVHDKLKAFCP